MSTASAVFWTAAALVLAGCGGGAAANGLDDPPATPDTPTQAPPRLLLTFDDNPPGAVRKPVLANKGTATAVVDLVSVGTRTVSFAADGADGSALVLPSYTGQRSGPFAAVRVVADGNDWLSPGESGFSFGADVMLNPRSMGTEVDNGDNVVQRGLFEDSAQYKIQVDKRHPSCVVRGSAGALVAKSKTVLGDGWYRVRCDRTGPDAITLTVTDLGAGGEPRVTSAEGPIGDVEMAGDAPLSVGAKVSANGDLTVSSTDQFNGEIDNVYYDSGSGPA